MHRWFARAAGALRNCALLVSLVAPLATQDSAAGAAPFHGRLVWTERPQSEVTVSWSTSRPGARHRVHYDTEARGGDVANYRQVADCARNGRFSGDSPELYYHHARLTGLAPATTYYLVVESDGAASREIRFDTAPSSDVPFAILNGGDSRSGRVTRRAMNELLARLTGEDASLLALAHGGDYVYDGESLSQWREWLDDHELTRAENGRMLPVIPTRGNHEATGPLFDEVFDWPGGGLGKNWFATELSPEVVLLTLNTETAAGGDQRVFLEQTLQAHRDTRWKLVQYHRPIWPAVKVPAAAKPHWQPLFDAHGVDLVCECDGHVLKRTVPIRGDERHPDGVVYIGEGGLGVKLRTPDADRWFLQPPGAAGSVHHVWMLRFSAEALALRAIKPDGEAADEHVLKPRT